MRGYAVRRALLQAAAFLLLAAPGAAAEGFRLAILGDSLTAGYGLEAGEAYPARLADALAAAGLEGVVLDHGISGDTTAGGRARVGWMIEEGPTHVLVELGGNDGLRGLEPGLVRANLDAILDQLAEVGVPAMLAGMRAPPNLGRRYAEAFDALFPAAAAAAGVPYLGFFLDGVADVPELTQDDGIHPNAAGVEEIVRRTAPAIAAWLRRPRDP